MRKEVGQLLVDNLSVASIVYWSWSIFLELEFLIWKNFDLMWKIYQSDEGRLNNRLWNAVNLSAGLHDFKVQHTIFHFIVIPHGLEWMLSQIIGCGTGEWSPSAIYISACAKAPTTDQLLMCWLVKVLLFFSERLWSQLGYLHGNAYCAEYPCASDALWDAPNVCL